MCFVSASSHHSARRRSGQKPPPVPLVAQSLPLHNAKNLCKNYAFATQNATLFEIKKSCQNLLQKLFKNYTSFIGVWKTFLNRITMRKTKLFLYRKRQQTVNLLLLASMVRIHPLPPYSKSFIRMTLGEVERAQKCLVKLQDTLHLIRFDPGISLRYANRGGYELQLICSRPQSPVRKVYCSTPFRLPPRRF